MQRVDASVQIRFGRGCQKLFFLPLILPGLNRLAETTNGKNRQKLAKTPMTKAVTFRITNRLEQTNVRLDATGKYSALCLTDFLVGDSLKCV